MRKLFLLKVTAFIYCELPFIEWICLNGPNMYVWWLSTVKVVELRMYKSYVPICLWPVQSQVVKLVILRVPRCLWPRQILIVLYVRTSIMKIYLDKRVICWYVGVWTPVPKRGTYVMRKYAFCQPTYTWVVILYWRNSWSVKYAT